MLFGSPDCLARGAAAQTQVSFIVAVHVVIDAKIGSGCQEGYQEFNPKTPSLTQAQVVYATHTTFWAVRETPAWARSDVIVVLREPVARVWCAIQKTFF
jgi:hypothetical protein